LQLLSIPAEQPSLRDDDEMSISVHDADIRDPSAIVIRQNIDLIMLIDFLIVVDEDWHILPISATENEVVSLNSDHIGWVGWIDCRC